jgi:hypothetical protein
MTYVRSHASIGDTLVTAELALSSSGQAKESTSGPGQPMQIDP